MYDLSEWRPIAATASRDRLAAAFKVVLTNHPDWAPDYVYNPAKLNDLLSWTGYTEPWPLKAFALKHGLGEGAASQPHTFKEVAKIMQQTRGTVANVLSPNGLRLYLVRAHSLVKNAPPDAQGPNLLRALGLSVGAWYALALHGEVYTPTQLAGLTPESVQEIHNIGPEKRDEITALMLFHGLWR